MKNMNHSENEDYKKVCPLNQLKDREGKRFIVDDVEIALFKVEGEIFAVSNVCPHQRTALIYDGFIDEGYITCPAHGWIFNLKSGRTPAGTKGLDIYDVKIIDDDVFVKVYKKSWNW